MKSFLIALALTATILATLGSAPAAEAHVCSGPQSDCGNCEEGEDHTHGDGSSDHGCFSDRSTLMDSGYNKKGLPGPGVLAILAVLGVVALTCSRRS